MKKKVLICFSIIIAIILIALSIIIVARSSKKEKLVYITDSDYLYDIAIEYLKEKTREEVRKNYNEEYPVFCDYKGIAIAQSGSKKYVYMWILIEVHKSKSISLSGSSGPYKFTFENDKVVNYEIPKDGSLYSKSIKEMFPDDLENKVSEYRVSSEKLKQEVEMYFSENVNNEENGTLFFAEVKTIISNNQILVKGTAENDINHQGEFIIVLSDDTKILKNDEDVDFSYIKEGTKVRISYLGGVKESYPAIVGNTIRMDIFDE